MLRMLSFTFLLLFVLPIVCSAEAARSFVVDDFEQGLSGWQEKEFLDRTVYAVVKTADGNHVLHASSHASASGLVKELSFNVKDYPFLTWRWKVEHALASGNALTKQGDDYAARVYVIFPHWLKPLTRTINYMWANRLAVGAEVPNPYYSRAMMVAVQSGNEKAGRWVTETRNVYEDFRRLFGEDPPQAGAVAIMTDTDNTGEQVQAWYDDIKLWSTEPGQ